MNLPPSISTHSTKKKHSKNSSNGALPESLTLPSINTAPTSNVCKSESPGFSLNKQQKQQRHRSIKPYFIIRNVKNSNSIPVVGGSKCKTVSDGSSVNKKEGDRPIKPRVRIRHFENTNSIPLSDSSVCNIVSEEFSVNKQEGDCPVNTYIRSGHKELIPKRSETKKGGTFVASQTKNEESDEGASKKKKKKGGNKKILDYSLFQPSPETCCALACTNTSEFHTLTCLPQDADNRHKWINQIDRHDWTPSETSSLCEIHFDADAWELNAAGVKVLKGDAVPTLYLHGEVIKSWVTLDGSGNVLKTASGSEENNDASTAKSTSVYIKEELPAVDIDDSIDKDASVYVKQEVLEPDIEMTEEPSDVEEPFETVYFNSNIDKTLEGDALSTETIRIKTLAETDSQTIVPEIAHVNIKTEVMDEPEEMMEEDGTAGAEAETWNCVECCVSFEERWTMEQHVLDVHSDSERARSLRKKQSDGSMLKNTGSSKSSARSKSISKVPLTHSVTCTTATTSSDATTQVSPAQAVPTIVGPAVSQADQAAAAKQFLVLIPQSTSVKHPMYLPLAKSSPTHTAVSPSPPPPPQPALPSVPSVPAVPTALPITPTCATDSSEMFCISLAHFPEATRLVIKKKLMEVIHTVERLKVSPEMIVIARKAPEIKPKL